LPDCSTPEDEAIEAAIEQFGEKETTLVAYCALMARDNRDGAEYRFWFDLLLKLVKACGTSPSQYAPPGSRAKARNKAESSRWKSNS
jgi:hypothetical protein